MGAYNGTVIRPSTGRQVAWTLAPILISVARDLDAIGITWYSIGNTDHLRGEGGHTPWKPGAPPGVVTAIDVMATPYADVERRVVSVLRSVLNTSFVDFVNTNGHQYDWNGRRQGPSGDYHWHLEVLGARTTGVTTLARAVWFERFSAPPAPPILQQHTRGDLDMQMVKVRSRDEVWKVLGNGVLQHVTPAQFNALREAGAPLATVDSEEELAAFGTVIAVKTVKVMGWGAA